MGHVIRYSTNDIRPTDPRLRCICGAFVVDVLPDHVAHDASGGLRPPRRCPAYAESVSMRFDLIYGPDWRRELEDLARDAELAAGRAA